MKWWWWTTMMMTTIKPFPPISKSLMRNDLRVVSFIYRSIFLRFLPNRDTIAHGVLTLGAASGTRFYTCSL